MKYEAWICPKCGYRHPEAMFRTDEKQDALFADFMARVEKFANQKAVHDSVSTENE